MTTLTVETSIDATVERCFDLARDISLHCSTASHTQERAIDGATEGLIGPGEQGTLMRDTLRWISPFGIIGKIADRLFLERHMLNFMLQRNAVLKSVAEGNA